VEVTQETIGRIVAAVLSQMGSSAAPARQWDSTQYHGRKFIGIYEDMNDAIAAAGEGYKAVRAMSVAQREVLITHIRKLIREEASIMGALGVEETGMGRADHKTAKHILVADKTPGTEDIVSQARTGDSGLTLVEMAPFGVVGAITPSTNPSETVLCNSIGMIAAGNGVVFNPHPGAIATSNYAVDLINRASQYCGVCLTGSTGNCFSFWHCWARELQWQATG
jgi:propionaldehyde dehydrogenase